MYFKSGNLRKSFISANNVKKTCIHMHDLPISVNDRVKPSRKFLNYSKNVLFDFILYVPINNFSVMSGWVFPG